MQEKARIDGKQDIARAYEEVHAVRERTRIDGEQDIARAYEEEVLARVEGRAVRRQGVAVQRMELGERHRSSFVVRSGLGRVQEQPTTREL